MNATGKAIDTFMNGLIKRNPGEEKFHQAVREVAQSVMLVALEMKKYRGVRRQIK